MPCMVGQSYFGAIALLLLVCSVAGQGGGTGSEPIICGGFAGLQCPAGLACVDDPVDQCHPDCGGVDCGGICVELDEEQATCGTIVGLTCNEGFTCFIGGDGCSPACGQSDCGGQCGKIPEPALNLGSGSPGGSSPNEQDAEDCPPGEFLSALEGQTECQPCPSMWGEGPEGWCALEMSWPELTGTGLFRRADPAAWTGGLGKLMDESQRFRVWVCLAEGPCAGGPDKAFCWVYDELSEEFVAWGPNECLQLVDVPEAAELGRRERLIEDGEIDFDADGAYDGMLFDEAFEADCQTVSVQLGWELEATRQRMRNQRAFAGLVGELQEQYPSAFAGSAMGRQPGDDATVWFKGEFPGGELSARLDAFTQETEMAVQVIDGMRWAYKEQEQRVQEASAELAGRFGGGVGGAVLPGDILLVSVPASDDFPPSEQGEDRPIAGLDPLAQELLPGMDAYGVRIIFTDVPQIDIDRHARGGRQMASDPAYDGTFAVCTSGFAVTRESDGVDGITTAAHCTGMSNFDAEDPEADFKMYHKGEHCEAYGDVEWKGSDHSEPAEFWANVGDKRVVQSVATAFSVNDVHCVYSRMRATRTCDYVYSTSVSQAGTLGYCSGRTSYSLVAFDHDNTLSGDSGGPYSYSTEAAGTVKGAKWLWWAWRSTMSRADLFPDALGVSVKVIS